MLDTIILTLNRMQFRITDPDKFTPSATSVLDPAYYPRGANGHVCCKQNPSRKDIKAGIYRPRLTLARRPQKGGYVITLRVEFSAPKLLFSNNFDELRDEDFNTLCKVLAQLLAEMGVRVTAATLKKVNVSAIHFSKNMVLTDYTSSSMIVNELGKIDLTKRLDLSNTDYRNDGHVIRYHSNAYEITFYDKIRDMQQAKISEKRAVEQDSALQLELFMKYIAPQPFEVLRMETRLNTRRKIRDVLVRIDESQELIFANLFNSSLSQKILLYYWHNILSGIEWLAMNQIKPEDIYRNIDICSNKPLKPAKLLQMVGTMVIADSIGVVGLRNLLGSTDRSWQRLKKELKDITIPEGQNYRAIDQVSQVLDEFLPLRIIESNKGRNHESHNSR